MITFKEFLQNVATGLIQNKPTNTLLNKNPQQKIQDKQKQLQQLQQVQRTLTMAKPNIDSLKDKNSSNLFNQLQQTIAKMI